MGVSLYQRSRAAEGESMWAALSAVCLSTTGFASLSDGDLTPTLAFFAPITHNPCFNPRNVLYGQPY